MDTERENKLHEIIQQEIQKYQAINLYITHITGVLCKIHQGEGKWIPGRVLFSKKDGNCAYVYTEPSLPSPWIDFSARSDHAVLFTTEQIFFQSKLARKFRGTIKGLTLMRCFNDGLYIEFFPPDSSSRVVSSTHCQPFDTSQTDSLDPLTRTSLQRELSYISRIRLMITNLLSSAGDTNSTPQIAKTGPFLPHPVEPSAKTLVPPELLANAQLNGTSTTSTSSQSTPSNLYLTPRPNLSQMNGTIRAPPTLPRPHLALYPQLGPRPPSLPKTNPPRGPPRVAPPRPPISTYRILPVANPIQSSSDPLALSQQKSAKKQHVPAPLRYELANDPFPNWKKEVLIPGWSSQIEWIGKPQIQFTPPGSSVPLLNKQAVKAYVRSRDEFKNIHHLINAFDFREVFCLCHKPEISEVITYMECMANVAGCNRWFHPECAGWDRFELDLYECDLICPLCTEYMERNPAVNSLVEQR